jgi:ribonuclease P protein component
MAGWFSNAGGPRAESVSLLDAVTPRGLRDGNRDLGLRRSERLRRRSEFQRVYSEGKSYAGSLLVLFVLTTPHLERKAGFVAGRRVGNAVSRNRAKRLMREAYRHAKHRIPGRDVHLVLVARHGCAESGAQAVAQDLAGLLTRAGFAGTHAADTPPKE